MDTLPTAIPLSRVGTGYQGSPPPPEHVAVRRAAALEVSRAFGEKDITGAFASLYMRPIKDMPSTNNELNKPGAESGIVVDGVGPIRYPLDAKQARAMIQQAKLYFANQNQARAAEAAAGADNGGRPAMYRPWEFNKDQFSMVNSQDSPIDWHVLELEAEKYVTRLMSFTFGSQCIRATLDKMLLYEPGAFSRPDER